MSMPPDESAILAIERPDRSLWTYYFLRCLAALPLFPILILPSWFRYHTMRYRFNADSISMSWGVLFRREIIVQHARIQDIHIRSNIVERWLGLARVLVQTASGDSSAELTIEGIKEYEALRDFLYHRMRGVKEGAVARSPETDSKPIAPKGELADALLEVASELRQLRIAIEQKRESSRGGPKDV